MSLTEGTLRKLQHLSFTPKVIRRGVLKGDRRSLSRGTSLEFADYRAYTPGDDLRRLDWNIYGRSDKPFLKLFEEEEDLGVHILIDTSESMAWGEGPANKFRFSRAIATGLALIALAGGDRCAITGFHEGQLSAQFGPVRNLMSFTGVSPFLEGLTAAGITNFNRSIRTFSKKISAPGLVAILSDLFSPDGFREGLNQLGHTGHEILLIHILSPDELNPPLAGDLKLVDTETGMSQEITVTGTVQKLFRTHVQNWRNEIYATCQTRRIHYFPLSTSDNPDKFLLLDLRRRGLVR